MDFGRAFTFVTEDPDWLKKILINGLIMLIPVVGTMYVLGWALEVGRRTANYEEPVRLPELEFGRYLGLGFKALVVVFVYSLPVMVLSLPMGILAPMASGSGTNSDIVGVLATLVSLVCSCVMILYSLVFMFIYPAAVMRTAVTNSIGAGLKIGEVFGLVKAAPSAYLVAILGILAASFAASLVGSLLCVVGIIFTSIYSMAVTGHFMGQAYRIASRKMA